MAKKKAQNLRTGIPLIGGSLIDDLNALGEAAGRTGVGTRLATELNRRFIHVNTRADAQAGLRGSVAIAPQKRRASRGVPEPGLQLRQNRIGEVANAIRDDEVPNWGQVRGLFTCRDFGGHVSGFEGWFEECVEQEREMAAAGDGLMHAFFGYTYEIPNQDDVNNGDPGNSEQGYGYYWQMLIPETTVVDRVSWQRTTLVSTNAGNIRFGLYEITSDSQFDIIAQTAALEALDTLSVNTTFTMDLDSRITLAPGMYVLAYVAPCFQHSLCIDESVLAQTVVMQLNESEGKLLRYGAFIVPTDGVNALPDTLDSSNTVDFAEWEANYSGFVPFTYWDDSQEFA